MKKNVKIFGIVILCFLMVGAVVGNVMYACPCVAAPTKSAPTEPDYGKFKIEGRLSDEHPAYLYRLGLLYDGDKVRIVMRGGLVEGSVRVTLTKGELAVEDVKFERVGDYGGGYKIQPSECVFEVPANGRYNLEIERATKGVVIYVARSVSYMGDIELLPSQRKSDEDARR